MCYTVSFSRSPRRAIRAANRNGGIPSPSSRSWRRPSQGGQYERMLYPFALLTFPCGEPAEWLTEADAVSPRLPHLPCGEPAEPPTRAEISPPAPGGELAEWLTEAEISPPAPWRRASRVANRSGCCIPSPSSPSLRRASRAANTSGDIPCFSSFRGVPSEWQEKPDVSPPAPAASHQGGQHERMYALERTLLLRATLLFSCSLTHCTSDGCCHNMLLLSVFIY